MYEDYTEFFKEGAQVRFENEAFPGKWEYGKVHSHYQRYGRSDTLRIEAESGEMVDFDYRYLDINPHNSLVRLVK